MKIEISSEDYETLSALLLPQERFSNEGLLQKGIEHLVIPIGNWRKEIIFVVKETKGLNK